MQSGAVRYAASAPPSPSRSRVDDPAYSVPNSRKNGPGHLGRGYQSPIEPLPEFAFPPQAQVPRVPQVPPVPPVLPLADLTEDVPPTTSTPVEPASTVLLDLTSCTEELRSELSRLQDLSSYLDLYTLDKEGVSERLVTLNQRIAKLDDELAKNNKSTREVRKGLDMVKGAVRKPLGREKTSILVGRIDEIDHYAETLGAWLYDVDNRSYATDSLAQKVQQHVQRIEKSLTRSRLDFLETRRQNVLLAERLESLQKSQQNHSEKHGSYGPLPVEVPQRLKHVVSQMPTYIWHPELLDAVYQGMPRGPPGRVDLWVFPIDSRSNVKNQIKDLIEELIVQCIPYGLWGRHAVLHMSGELEPIRNTFRQRAVYSLNDVMLEIFKSKKRGSRGQA